MEEKITVHLAMKPEDLDSLPRLRELLSTASFRDGLLTDLAESLHRKMACDLGGNWEVDAALDVEGDIQIVRVTACPHGENPVFCVYCNLECGD